MALTTRSNKGQPLTHAEMDANLSGLADGSLITAVESSVVNFDQSGTGAVTQTMQDKGRRSINLFDVIPKALWSGIEDGTNTTDLTSYIQQAITNYQGRRIVVPHGKFRCDTSLTIAARGYHFEGEMFGRFSDGGTEFDFRGTGALFEIGTDDSGAWDAASYDGYQDQCFERFWISHGATDSTLAYDSSDPYKSGAYAFRDWRGGGIVMNHVGFEKMEYGFWGIQSDINLFDFILATHCKYGIYAGPRSDQFTIRQLYASLCDQAVVCDKATDLRLITPQIVGCGTDTLHAVLIKQGSGLVIFDDPWFEHLQGYAGADQLAFVGAGTEAGYGSTTTAAAGVYIRKPFIYTTAAAATYHTKYLVEVGKARDVLVDDPQTVNNGNNNLDQYIAFQSGTAYTAADSRAKLVGHGNDLTKAFVNNGTGTPEFSYHLWGNSSHQLGSVNGRLYVNRIGGTTGADSFFIGGENIAGAFQVNAPNYSTGQTTRIDLRRVVKINAAAAPSSGTWEAGDVTLNNAPAVGKIIGWQCTTAGTPGTHSPIGVLPGISATQGNTSRTLTAGNGQGSEETSYWNTAITADRDCTLSKTGAWNGAKFRIVRTAACTGAFNINVLNGAAGPTLKAMGTAGTSADFEFNGTDWIQTGFSTL